MKKWIGVPAAAVCLAAALSSFSVAHADALADASGAFSSNAADQLASEQAWRTAPVPCRIDILAAEGVPQKNLVVATVHAEDHALAEGTCLSADETASYTTTIQLSFEYFKDGAWHTIPGSQRTCSTGSSTAGQATVPCENSKIYDPTDPTVGRWHRASLRMLSPIDNLPPKYSTPFLTANLDVKTQTVTLPCSMDC